MPNREDPTQRAQKLTRAAGVASLLLSTIVDDVADKRLREREATTAEEAERWSPTEAELQALRHRFIEYQALDAAGLSAWRPFREHYAADLISVAIKAVYRLIVFCAACVVIYQFIMHGRL